MTGSKDAASEAPPPRRSEGRSATLVMVAILASKLVGLVRQRITAHYFGTSTFADVIAAAFRIGNVAQSLLGEGTLSASFIPIYARLHQDGDEEEAAAFARSALGLLGVVVFLVSVVGVALAPWLTLAVAGGYDDAKIAMTVQLVRILMPMTGLLVLCAWALGVLNAHRRFFTPYAAPILWSLAQIGALLVGGAWLSWSGLALARALAAGAFIGAVVELVFLMRRAKPYVQPLRPAFDTANRWVRKAASRLPGILVSRGVIILSGVVDTLLVSFLGKGENAVFSYAQMLYLLPMSLLGTGEAAVSLTEMTRDEGDVGQRNRRMQVRLGATLARIATLAVPAIVVLVGFGSELITVLLRSGRFDQNSVIRVAEVLQVYGLALLANASQRMLATTFFALGDTKLPARFSVIRVLVSTALALWWMQSLGVVGVVLGAMVAGWTEALLLGWSLRRRIGGLGLREVPWAKLLVVAAAVTAAPWGLRRLLEPSFARGFVGSFLVLAVAGLVFLGAVTATGIFDVRRLLRR